MTFLVDHLGMKPEYFSEQYRDQDWLWSYHETTTYGFGFDGFREKSHQAPNVNSVYPLTPLTSKFNTKTAELTIPDEYQAFLDRFETVSLIAFGTTWSPLESDILTIVEALKLSNPETTGFILGLKERNPAYQQIMDMNVPNLFLTPWVPQKELMASDKVKLFMSHGGANSLIESFYFGTPVLGFGQDGDQYGMIHRMQKIGLAKFGYPEKPAAELWADMEDLLYDSETAVKL